MNDDMIIRPNKDNDKKFMTGGMAQVDPTTNKKKKDEDALMESGGNESPVEYFTE